ncbi:unnamed protein product [Spodoptera exigua]|nr:unnamed protein product [Spodoptera exigua]
MQPVQVSVALCCVLGALLLRQATASPVMLFVRLLRAYQDVLVVHGRCDVCDGPQPLQPEQRPLSLVSELSSRLGAHPARLQDARLPLPSSQDLEAIKKVAQILVTLGQQVIPGIIGEPVPAPGGCEPAAGGGGDDVPNDPVNLQPLCHREWRFVIMFVTVKHVTQLLKLHDVRRQAVSDDSANYFVFEHKVATSLRRTV